MMKITMSLIIQFFGEAYTDDACFGSWTYFSGVSKQTKDKSIEKYKRTVFRLHTKYHLHFTYYFAFNTCFMF